MNTRVGNLEGNNHKLAPEKKKLVDLSVKYGILCSETAFVGVMKKKNGDIVNMGDSKKSEIGPMSANFNSYDGPSVMQN